MCYITEPLEIPLRWKFPDFSVAFISQPLTTKYLSNKFSRCYFLLTGSSPYNIINVIDQRVTLWKGKKNQVPWGLSGDIGSKGWSSCDNGSIAGFARWKQAVLMVFTNKCQETLFCQIDSCVTDAGHVVIYSRNETPSGIEATVRVTVCLSLIIRSHHLSSVGLLARPEGWAEWGSVAVTTPWQP